MTQGWKGRRRILLALPQDISTQIMAAVTSKLNGRPCLACGHLSRTVVEDGFSFTYFFEETDAPFPGIAHSKAIVIGCQRCGFMAHHDLDRLLADT
jgi:hypothetical protein